MYSNEALGEPSNGGFSAKIFFHIAYIHGFIANLVSHILLYVHCMIFLNLKFYVSQ